MTGTEAARYKNRREAERLAALDHLGAVQPEVDHVLQQLVDDVREIFGTDLCMANLILSDVQYFRAWSGEPPEDLAEARQDPRLLSAPPSPKDQVERILDSGGSVKRIMRTFCTALAPIHSLHRSGKTI